MPKPRKTVEVDNIRVRINNMIANEEHVSHESAKDLCYLLESILMDTNNYKGFSYIHTEAYPPNYQEHGADWTDFDKAYGYRRCYYGGY